MELEKDEVASRLVEPYQWLLAMKFEEGLGVDQNYFYNTLAQFKGTYEAEDSMWWQGDRHDKFSCQDSL